MRSVIGLRDQGFDAELGFGPFAIDAEVDRLGDFQIQIAIVQKVEASLPGYRLAHLDGGRGDHPVVRIRHHDRGIEFVDIVATVVQRYPAGVARSHGQLGPFLPIVEPCQAIRRPRLVLNGDQRHGPCGSLHARYFGKRIASALVDGGAIAAAQERRLRVIRLDADRGLLRLIDIQAEISRGGRHQEPVGSCGGCRPARTAGFR